MQNRTFFTWLFIVNALATLIAAACVAIWDGGAELRGFGATSMAFFTTICLLLFLLGRKSARSSNKQAFNGVISASVFFKIVLSLLFLGIYKKMNHPETVWYVVVFLLHYGIFTAFEVWFMTKLGKMA